MVVTKVSDGSLNELVKSQTAYEKARDLLNKQIAEDGDNDAPEPALPWILWDEFIVPGVKSIVNFFHASH